MGKAGRRVLFMYMRGDVGLTLTLNNSLSTYYVPGIVLKAGGAKSLYMAKITMTIQGDGTTRMPCEPLRKGATELCLEWGQQLGKAFRIRTSLTKPFLRSELPEKAGQPAAAAAHVERLGRLRTERLQTWADDGEAGAVSTKKAREISRRHFKLVRFPPLGSNGS